MFSETRNISNVFYFQNVTFFCQHPNLDFHIYFDISHFGLLSVEISSLLSETLIGISLKQGGKQGINFRPNHRDMSTRNCYLFEHEAIFVLFFVQKPG